MTANILRARFYLGSSAFASTAVDAELRVDRVAGWRFLARCERIAAVLAEHRVIGATIAPGVGLWEGTLEPSAVIECLSTDWTADDVPAVAEGLRAAFDQDSVLWTVETLKAHGSADR